MVRFSFILFLLQFPGSAYAQCDSVEVREWLRAMNRDTVCITTWDTCKDVHMQSQLRYYGLDSSDFCYYYRDSATGATSSKFYYRYQLSTYVGASGDTDFTIVYQQGRCAPDIYVKAIVNDSLTRPSKKGHIFYDYYSEVVYDANGKIIVTWTETIVQKRGKKFRRTVYMRYERKFNKERVRMKRIRV